jgi:hypothetical protein
MPRTRTFRTFREASDRRHDKELNHDREPPATVQVLTNHVSSPCQRQTNQFNRVDRRALRGSLRKRILEDHVFLS